MLKERVEKMRIGNSITFYVKDLSGYDEIEITRDTKNKMVFNVNCRVFKEVGREEALDIVEAIDRDYEIYVWKG